MCWHPNVTERVLEITNSNGSKENLNKHEKIVELKTQADFSSITSEDETKATCTHIGSQLRKPYVMKAHQRRLEKRKPVYFSFPLNLQLQAQSTNLFSRFRIRVFEVEDKRHLRSWNAGSLKVIHTEKALFRNAEDYRSYRFENRSTTL